GISRRLAAESVSSECTSSQMRFTTFTLFDCRRPMKCQRKVSPYSACLASRSCARFSPTTLIPASASAAISASVTYLVAATIVTASPTSARTRPMRFRISSGESTEHPLDAARAPVAAMREVQLGAVAGADVDPVDAVDAGPAQSPLGRGPEIELSTRGQIRVEERGYLVADLVAARPDR